MQMVSQSQSSPRQPIICSHLQWLAFMLHSLAVANYRSVRDLVLPLAGLNLVTGANGSGKSNLYRGLRLLADAAHGNANRAIALEGGLPSVLWAGPEQFSRLVKQGRQPVQGGPRQQPVSLRLGFSGDGLGYAIDFGLPTPVPGTMFVQDPEIKREVIWHAESWNERRGLVDRKGPMVRSRDDMVIKSRHNPDTDISTRGCKRQDDVFFR